MIKDHGELALMLTRWIDLEIHNNISIDELASTFGYSKGHLQRIFKKEVGYSISCYIRCRKLSHAAIILKLSRCTIKSIAKKCHFHYIQSFSRAFYDQFSLTPRQYRNMFAWNSYGIMLPFLEEKIIMNMSDIFEGDFHSDVIFSSGENDADINYSTKVEFSMLSGDILMKLA